MKYYLMEHSGVYGTLCVARVYDDIVKANEELEHLKCNKKGSDYTIIPMDDNEFKIVKWDDALKLFFMYNYSSEASAKRNLNKKIMNENYEIVSKEDEGWYYECSYVDEAGNDFLDAYCLIN